MSVARRGTRSRRASRGGAADARDTPLRAVVGLGVGFAVLLALAVVTVGLPSLEDDPRAQDGPEAGDERGAQGDSASIDAPRAVSPSTASPSTAPSGPVPPAAPSP